MRMLLIGIALSATALTGCGSGEAAHGGYSRAAAVTVARRLCPGLRPDQVRCTARGDSWRCDTTASNGDTGLVVVEGVAAGTMSTCG